MPEYALHFAPHGSQRCTLIVRRINAGIDKKSSAELQEAINSMYHYYAAANICYVYLSDILRGCPPLRDTPNSDVVEPSTWHYAFTKSRWFTRGWTLQELLAPSRMNFYGCEWNSVGEKEHLTKTISFATGIDSSVLTDHSRIPSYSVAQRMSWAARRETTRVEDLAYCLLGIFGWVMLPRTLLLKAHACC